MKKVQEILKQLKPMIKATAVEQRGSAAIVLSLMVSTAVLSTIFHSQKSIDWFLSSQEQSQFAWVNEFISKYGVTLGGYLVANNLILCREEGWDGDSNLLCKWNEETEEEYHFSKFNLKNKTTKTVGNKTLLSFTGTINEEVLSARIAKSFTIDFDLVNWKDTDIQGLIGTMPDSLCRDKTTLQVISGTCPSHPPAPNISCKDSSNQDISNSECEYISPVDRDYYIVLISVKPVETSQAGDTVKTVYAGIRRPLAHIKVTVVEQAKCGLICASAVANQVYPECRGEFQPPTGEEYSSVKMQVLNQGPGALYSLSLLKQNIPLNQNREPIPDSTHYTVTDDVLKRASAQVLLPGKSIVFQDTVHCNDAINYQLKTETKVVQGPRARRWWRTPSPSGFTGLDTEKSPTKSINMHGQPFMQVDYTMGSMDTPTGVCIKNANGFNEVIEGDNLCNNNNEYRPNTTCGQNNEGVCRYPHIEPRRKFGRIQSSTQVKQSKTLVQEEAVTVILYIPPH